MRIRITLSREVDGRWIGEAPEYPEARSSSKNARGSSNQSRIVGAIGIAREIVELSRGLFTRLIVIPGKNHWSKNTVTKRFCRQDTIHSTYCFFIYALYTYLLPMCGSSSCYQKRIRKLEMGSIYSILHHRYCLVVILYGISVRESADRIKERSLFLDPDNFLLTIYLSVSKFFFNVKRSHYRLC